MKKELSIFSNVKAAALKLDPSIAKQKYFEDLLCLSYLTLLWFNPLKIPHVLCIMMGVTCKHDKLLTTSLEEKINVGRTAPSGSCDALKTFASDLRWAVVAHKDNTLSSSRACVSDAIGAQLGGAADLVATGPHDLEAGRRAQ